MKLSSFVEPTAIFFMKKLIVVIYLQGITIVRFFMPMASLQCPKTSHIVTLYTGCPFKKRLKFWYPYHFSDLVALHGNPVDKENKTLLYDLEVHLTKTHRISRSSLK